MPTFEPRLEILSESKLDLWPELAAVPSDFVLYGGTALALRLGHRVSEDFDFFSSEGFDPDRLQARLPFFQGLDKDNPEIWVHQKRDNLEAYVERRAGIVKVACLAAWIACAACRTQSVRPARGYRSRRYWTWRG